MDPETNQTQTVTEITAQAPPAQGPRPAPPLESEADGPRPAPPQENELKPTETASKHSPKPQQPQASPFDAPQTASVMPAILGAVVFVVVLVGMVLFAYLKGK